MAGRTEIIIALDTGRLDEARDIITAAGDEVGFYKVGSILFTASGPAAVEMVRACGKQVFLDLKFHDIPNTVAGAVRSAARMGVSLLTVHCAGGKDMMRAAREASGAEPGGVRPRVVGVTVLTSLAAAKDTTGTVLRLAGEAAEAGLDGVVCSPLEVGQVRRAFGEGFLTVVPGIRLADDAAGDQARVGTPGRAARDGADFLVVGRSVTGAKEPRAALAAIRAELGRA